MKFSWLNIKHSLRAVFYTHSLKKVLVDLNDNPATDLLICRYGHIHSKENNHLSLHKGEVLFTNEIDLEQLNFADSTNLFHFHFEGNEFTFNEVNARDGKNWKITKPVTITSKDQRAFKLKATWEEIATPPIVQHPVIAQREQCLNVEFFLRNLYLYFEQLEEIKIPQRAKSQTCYESIKHYILENFYTGISREKTAQDLKISEVHISKLFQTFDKNSFQQTLSGTTLEFGATLLANAPVKTEQVSQLCGFANRENFSTAFKKYFDLTPSEFRKKVKEGESITFNFLPQSFHLYNLTYQPLANDDCPSLYEQPPQYGWMVPFYVVNYSSSPITLQLLTQDNEWVNYEQTEDLVYHDLVSCGTYLRILDEKKEPTGWVQVNQEATMTVVGI